MLIGQSLGNILHTAEISSLMHVQNIHIYGKLFRNQFGFRLPKLITVTKIVLMSVDRKIIYQFRHIFRQLFQNQKFLIDYVFDWNKVSWLWRHYDVTYSNTSLCSSLPEKILIVLILASKMAIDWQPIRRNLCTNPFRSRD